MVLISDCYWHISKDKFYVINQNNLICAETNTSEQAKNYARQFIEEDKKIHNLATWWDGENLTSYYILSGKQIIDNHIQVIEHFSCSGEIV